MATSSASPANDVASRPRNSWPATDADTTSSSDRIVGIGWFGSRSRMTARTSGATAVGAPVVRTTRNTTLLGMTCQGTYIAAPRGLSRPRYFTSLTTPITRGFVFVPGRANGTSWPIGSRSLKRNGKADALSTTTGGDAVPSASVKSRPCSSRAPMAPR